MAEWTMAPVLKTVDVSMASVGSNPTPSAISSISDPLIRSHKRLLFRQESLFFIPENVHVLKGERPNGMD